MNLDLYTEEFRDFKYLKSSMPAVKYYRDNQAAIQKVQPWIQVNDPKFVWETRLEFLEQLFDLADETVYFVTPTNAFEDPRMYEIVKPFIYKGNAIQVDDVASLEDITEIENDPSNFYLSSRENSMVDKIFITMWSCPLVPTESVNYSAMFYDKEWALKYKDAIMYLSRMHSDAITAVSRLF